MSVTEEQLSALSPFVKSIRARGSTSISAIVLCMSYAMLY